MPEPTLTTPSRPAQSRRWPGVASLAALIAISLAAGASAQRDVGEETVDTRYTPVAKTTTAWAHVGGAKHGEDTVSATSPTPIDVDFHSVAFENDLHGFAGGSKCSNPPSGDLAGAALTAYLRSEECARVPVIYEYIRTETEESWRPVYVGTASERGYVGGIAFMRDGSALAVGGDGRYPRREEEPSTAAGDDAGNARAWIYRGGFWSRFEDLPDGMRGLTAVAMSQRLGDCQEAVQCGLAGGYRQLWRWRDTGFDKGYFADPAQDNPGGEPAGSVVGDGWRFRVRQIEFTPKREGGFAKAIAVTSGCCDANAANNTARVLVFGQAAGAEEAAVYPRELRADGDELAANDRVPKESPNSDATARRDLPDSFYALDLRADPSSDAISLIASTGRPSSESGSPELTSRVLGDMQVPSGPTFRFDPESGSPPGDHLTEVTTARLVAGDGGAIWPGRHLLDWAVGSMGNGQGVAFSTEAREERVDFDIPIPRVQVLSCPDGDLPWSSALPDPSCKPYESDALIAQTESKHLFALPTYALNAFKFTEATEGVGWAVGDRGALVRLGGVGTTSSTRTEPPEPKLGSPALARFAGSEVYDAFRPLPTSARAGRVPSLAANGTEDLERRRFIPGGAPNPTIPTSSRVEDLQTVIMSRDGSEGWAIGGGLSPLTQGIFGLALAPTTLYRYDGTRWSRCAITDVGEILPADPACSGLAELYNQKDPIRLVHAARVPLENDDDPSNDDDLEIVAVGERYSPPGLSETPVVARFRNGGWSIDKTAMEQLEGAQVFHSIAFTAPDDGWLLNGETLGGPTLWHWDGKAWTECNSDAGAREGVCGDPDELLPMDDGMRRPSELAVAGKRVYLATNRIAAGTSEQGASRNYPAIFYRDLDPDGAEGPLETKWTASYDPGAGQAPTAEQEGALSSFAVAQTSDGRYIGWAAGQFGTTAVEDNVNSSTRGVGASLGNGYSLLRLTGAAWVPYREDDAAADYLPGSFSASHDFPSRPVILDADSGAAMIYKQDSGLSGPTLVFNPVRGRWRVLPTPFHRRENGSAASSAFTRAIAPDGDGGAWLAARVNREFGSARPAVHFWHYDDEAPRQVFREAPHPIREQITSGTAGADGSFWVTTNSSFVYRYDRMTGWDRLRIPGWDPGRIVTRSSEASAVAVGPDGEGLVVGKNGRIAQVSALGVRLDPAAGKKCGDAGATPCATGRDLRAAAIASDGSAMIGGDASVLLYRPPGGGFTKLNLPGGSEAATITDISLPTPDRAWLVNTVGQVFAGRLSAEGWSFGIENRGARGRLLSLDESDRPLPIRGIEVDRNGEGYAVGDRGLILERRGDAGWQRIKTRFLDTFRSVALAPEGRSAGALIGGDMGLVLTLEGGDFRVAREADLFNPLNFGDGGSIAARVTGLAIVPGLKEGQVEAWAVQQVPAGNRRTGPGAVLHYTNDPDEPLLQPGQRVEPLPDVAAPREGEIAFAAFGRSDCHSAGTTCPESHAEGLFNEVVAQRVTDEVIDRSKETGTPTFAIFTGDVGRAAGQEEPTASGRRNTPLHKSWVHRRWKELVADRFADAGVPLFGAVGLNDLDRTAACQGTTCADSKTHAAGSGLTWGWRKAMEGMAAPWGTGPKPPDAGGLSFEPVAVEGGAQQKPPLVEGARTHYAVDVSRSGKKIARLIFLDNSMRTLNSSDPNQNPVEPDGQAQWLERVLAGVDKARGQQAIVVMNTPTYSYAAGTPTDWAQDVTTVETTLMNHDVKAVVSGRLGWNGRYWATAPGVHAPCPGGDYIPDEDAPQEGDRPCNEETAFTEDPANQIGDRLATTMRGLGAPEPPGLDAPDTGLAGVLPWIVAASAGGTFGPTGADDGPASDGFWHGYSIVRLAASGDPRETIVEQRPVFDWVSITAPSHVLKPRQRMTLRGEGREPVGIDVAPRYDAINSPAITHRYDLVLADEENPSLPRKTASGEYVQVPATVGEVDRETGVVTAKSGRQERTYAVAILSVGDKAASWPIVFEPSRSFKARVAAAPGRSVINTPPRPAQVRPLVPPPVVLNTPPSPTPPAAPPPNVPQVTLPTLKLPAPPALPNVPGLPAGTPTPPPPPPAAPPPPPGSTGALPLSLQAPLAPISIVTTVIPPSPPPVNPAPPGGSAARKEARQRQAATAKSEEGGGEGAGEGQSSGESGSAEMTRRDRTRPAPSFNTRRPDDEPYAFTAVSQTEQVSAWSRGALYGGMTLATAMALALGWGIVRPTPRRRHPPRPAPQTVRTAIRRDPRE